jgi:hypothetical protein
MFINATKIRQYIKSNNKQISKEALEAINEKVRQTLDGAIRNTGRFTRIGSVEIHFTK